MSDDANRSRTTPALPVTSNAFERALPVGFAAATAVWMTAYICRFPWVQADVHWMLFWLLATIFVAGVLAGPALKRSVWEIVLAGVILSVLDALLVLSVLETSTHGPAGVSSAASAAVTRVDMPRLIWIPGSIIATTLLFTIGGLLSRNLLRRRSASSTLPGSQQSHAGDVRRSQAVLALAATVTTLCLIYIGGIVTTQQAGLAVPDWPNSYQYNMFLFPFSKMIGGIFYEHAHRLVGTLVGMEMIALCLWLWVRRRRLAAMTSSMDSGSGGASTRRRSVWTWRLEWIGLLCLVMVIIQGVLGGLRVTVVNTWGQALGEKLAIVHACTAQIFLLTILALATLLIGQAVYFRTVRSEATSAARTSQQQSIRRVIYTIGFGLTCLIIIQTLLGAISRHLNYDWALLAHMLGAVVIAVFTLMFATLLLIHGTKTWERGAAFSLMAVIGIQLVLGFITWWLSTRLTAVDKNNDPSYMLIVSSHVMTGAVLLGLAWCAAIGCLPSPHGRLSRTGSLDAK